jgi:hypothetical protein
MKNSILIFLLLATATTMHAQNLRITAGNPRTETYNYQKGGDSVRFTILGKNDTVQETEYYRSGKIQRLSWKKDSLYKYDVLGRLTKKTFGIIEDKNIPNDSTLIFYSNGQIETKTTFKNKASVMVDYNKDGKIVMTTTIQYAPSVRYAIERDRHNVLLHAIRIDTISRGETPETIQYDTLYFANGRLFKTGISDNDYNDLGTQYYNVDGSLAKTTLPDSLQLIEFKDNVDCYYGLKNKQGDTIVKPRFDRFDTQSKQFWAAYSGTSLILLDRKGAPLSGFPNNLTNINGMWGSSEKTNWNGDDSRERRIKDADIDRRKDLIDTTSSLYSFSQDNKHGVMTDKGEIVMPPQYLNVSRHYLHNGKFFHYEERKGFQLLKSGFLTVNGKPLFSSDDFKTVMYTNYQEYFFLCEQPYQVIVGCNGQTSSNSDQATTNTYRNAEKNIFGLGKSDGTVLLERKFNAISHVGTSPLFITSIYKKEKGEEDITSHDGIFNSRSKRWLVDSVGFKIENTSITGAVFFVVQQLSKEKYGIMDTTGRYILPLAYDSVGIVDDVHGLFWVKKAGQYQIFDIKGGKPNLHKTSYDFLSLINFDGSQHFLKEDVNYFFAQRKNKWGVIDADEKTIKPFEYDYVSKVGPYKHGFVMVKNNQATYFTLRSLPNPMPDFPHAREGSYSQNKTGSYTLVNNTNRLFIINDTGKVLVPPQYKQVNSANNSDFILIEADNKQKKLVFLQSGKQLDYPFDYQIKWASPYSKLILVKHSAEISYGVVSTEGKLIAPCKNYGVAIGDYDSSVFFVKQDTPNVKRSFLYGQLNYSDRIASDTLGIEDNHWLMYDGKGKMVSDKPFRFPIDFKDSIGIGMKDDYFNLYKTDGSVVMPFSKNTEGGQKNKTDITKERKGFNNIRYDDDNYFYILFYNQGMTPTLILTKQTGEIVVNGGRYDGISKFYGKYALVTAAGKMGLIDTLGQEIIAPQDLREYSENLVDSLNVVNKDWRNEWVARGKKGNCESVNLPIESVSDYKNFHPDSLAITKGQRSVLWNLLLDKSRLNSIKTASDIFIERVDAKATASFFTWDRRSEKDVTREHRKIIVETNSLSFILMNENDNSVNDHHFYNFYRRNNRWEELKINDLLQVQGEKRWQINNLITKKVKALKDQQIDCSNAAAFITTVENRFMLTKDGVDFCFESTGGGGDFVVISFTWAELKPFLKLKVF